MITVFTNEHDPLFDIKEVRIGVPISNGNHRKIIIDDKQVQVQILNNNGEIIGWEIYTHQHMLSDNGYE